MEMSFSEGASAEPVNGHAPPSTGRKGKRHLVSDDDLQPSPKKTYNLRNRKSKFSEEEVATRTPLSNRRTGKRLAESESGFQVTSKKSYYSRRKTSTLSEEEVSKDSQEGKEIVNEEIEDMKGSVETNTNGFEEFMGDMRGNVEEALEISTKASAVNDEGQLVSEEEKQNVGEEIEGIKENLKVTITAEETKEEMGMQKGTESTDGKKMQNVEETLEMSAKACAVNDEGQLFSNKEEQNVAEEIEDMKESLEVATNITVEETKEELFSNKEEQNVAEEIEDMKESLEVATNITVEETKEELVFHKDYDIGKNIQNVGETLEMRTSDPVENAKGEMGYAEDKEIIIEDTKDIGETVVGTTIAVEVKGELVSQEVKKSLDEEVGNGNTILAKCERFFVEESVAELGSKEVKEYINEETTGMEEPAAEVNTKMIAEEANKYLVSQEVNKSLDEEVGRGNTILVKCVRSFVEKSVAELGSKEVKEYINEETTDMEEPAAEVNTKMIAEEANKYLGLQTEKESMEQEVGDAQETSEMGVRVAIENMERELVFQEETKGMDEETEDMNVPDDEVKGELASHGGVGTDEEMKDAVELWEVSRSGCTTDAQEKTEDEVISANEALEASKMTCVEEAKEDKSFAPVPKTPVATRSKILFMGNLPYSIDCHNVLSFFKDVGNVIDIRMAKNADGSMKGFCHVTFATAAAAVKALEKNGEIFHNRNVKLDLAENLSNKHVLDSTVLVRGLERSQPEEDIRKSLMKHFGDCGSIKNIHIPKDIQAGDTRRVAFIRFEDSEAVSKAVKLCGSELGDSKLFVKEVGRSRFRRKSSNAKRRNSRRQVTK